MFKAYKQHWGYGWEIKDKKIDSDHEVTIASHGGLDNGHMGLMTKILEDDIKALSNHINLSKFAKKKQHANQTL